MYPYNNLLVSLHYVQANDPLPGHISAEYIIKYETLGAGHEHFWLGVKRHLVRAKLQMKIKIKIVPQESAGRRATTTTKLTSLLVVKTRSLNTRQYDGPRRQSNPARTWQQQQLKCCAVSECVNACVCCVCAVCGRQAQIF